MEKIKENLKKYSAAYLTAILILSMVGISFAVATFSRTSGENMINLGQISMTYEEPTNAYVLENALPISDDSGKGLTKYFEFKVTTHATTNENDSTGLSIPYEINLGELAIDKDKTKLSKNQIKVYVTKVVNGSETVVLEPTLLSNLATSTLNTGATVAYSATDVHKNAGSSITTTYRLRAWIDKDVDANLFTDKVYQYKFNVNINSNVGALDVQPTLVDAIMEQGVVTTGDGLYVSTDTNTGAPTYYYRGNVENNYVSFAGYTWRVIRINEAGTVRLIMEDGINSNIEYVFNPTYNEYKYMYYTESNVENGAMKRLEDWYDEHLSAYDSKIVTSTYCEQAKVKKDDSYTSGSATMEVYDSYTPDFRCKEYGNEKGIVTSKIGLISVDEVLHAGGIYSKANDYYLANERGFWTMSPAGFNNYGALAWRVFNVGSLGIGNVSLENLLRPVISLDAGTLVTGSGAIDDMWIVKP